MTLLLAGIGWGLLAFGAITHLWHHDRLRQLLGLHVEHDRALAGALTAAEVSLSLSLPVLYLLDSPALSVVAGAAGALALGFVVWIARLLLTDSDLPCACSFADAPTTVWSLGRALCTGLVVLYPVAPVAAGSADDIATLIVALALGGAIFVLPDAISWPEPSRALLARIEAHRPGSAT